jgi:hypothetical protein
MNPYLEQSDSWEDFHQDFMTRARESLSSQVGPNYMVKLEVRLYLHELSAEERRYFGRADVGVTGPRVGPSGPCTLSASATAAYNPDVPSRAIATASVFN